MNEGEPLAPVAIEGTVSEPQSPTALAAPNPDTEEVRAELLATVLHAPMSWPRPEQYRDVTDEMIPRCNTHALIAYSRAAQMDRNWGPVVAFQKEVVRREPRNIRAYVFLSFALENIGEFEEAARVWEMLITLPGYELNPRYAHRPIELRVRLSAHRAGRSTLSSATTRAIRHDLPSSHMEVTPEMLPSCGHADLIRYSMQAQKDERWDRVEMFQWELVKRQPRNLVAHILLVRAFIKQGKTEDAASLMQTVEELRSPHDDSRTEKAVLSLKYRLCETALKIKPRHADPAENPVPAPASRAAITSPVPSSRLDAPSTPKKPSNIDTSRFDNFLASIRREAENWPQVQGQGEGWRSIPEDEREFFVEAFGEFQKQLARAMPKGPNKPFWGKFDDISMQIHRGTINVHALDTLIERTENTARGTKVNLGRLEPIRLKEQR